MPATFALVRRGETSTPCNVVRKRIMVDSQPPNLASKPGFQAGETHTNYAVVKVDSQGIPLPHILAQLSGIASFWTNPPSSYGVVLHFTDVPEEWRWYSKV